MRKGLLGLAVLAAILLLLPLAYVVFWPRSESVVVGPPSPIAQDSTLLPPSSASTPAQKVDLIARTAPPDVRDENALRAWNHSSLLRAQKEIRSARQTGSKERTAILSQSVREWGWTLYLDAVTTAIIRMEVSDPSRASLIIQLDSSKLRRTAELLSGCLPYIDESYAREFGDAVLVACSDGPKDPGVAEVVTQKISRLVDLRKRLSDNYFKGQIRAFITDSARPLDNKIEYMAAFHAAGDQSLVSFASEYFLNLKDKDGLTPEQSQRIDAVFGTMRRK